MSSKCFSAPARQTPPGALIVGNLGLFSRHIAEFFQKSGFSYFCVHEAEEAQHLVTSENIHVVITPLAACGSDLADYCVKLRAARSDIYLHIVIVTGGVSEDQRVDMIRLGADEIICDADHPPLVHARLERITRIANFMHGLTVACGVLERDLEELETEVATAARLQAEFLPPDKSYTNINVASHFLPALMISGDCQNHFELPDKRVLAYQADVSGHGIRAALLSVTILRLLTPGFCSWQDGSVLEAEGIVERLNNRLLSHTETPEYFTFFLAIVDPSRELLTICQAGHPPALVKHPDGTVSWVGEGGFPVGLFPGAAYESVSRPFPRGSKLVIMSDGVLECPDRTGAILGQDQLDDVIREASAREDRGDMPLERHVLDYLRNRVGASGFSDDVSMLSIGFSELVVPKSWQVSMPRSDDAF